MNVEELNALDILDRITDGFFALDYAWNFTYVNEEATKLLFRNREGLVGKNVWDEFPEAIELPFYEMYNHAIKQQVPVTFDSYFPPLRTWFDVRAYPSPNGLSVFFQDITEKKEAVLQSEQHYKSLFEHHPDAVFSFDLEGNYLSVNKGMEELLGYSEEEYKKLSYIPLVSEDSLEITNAHFNKAANGETQNYETKALHKNGHVVHVCVANIPIIVNEKIVGVYGIAKDITKQKQAEEMLIRSEKLSVVGELSASIAHEIRNPLTSLKGFLQLMKSTGTEVPAYFDIMTDEISRIESITGELLLHAKPQAHRFNYENVKEITEHVLVLLGSQALMNNVEVVTDVDTIPPFKCIGNQIKQVLINVIKNAIESMPNGGELVVQVKHRENKVCIQVRDTGCGIPEEFLDEVGLPFYTTKEKGTGLGMMTTMRIVETHGGEFRISSKVNVGTDIEINLPIT